MATIPCSNTISSSNKQKNMNNKKGDVNSSIGRGNGDSSCSSDSSGSCNDRMDAEEEWGDWEDEGPQEMPTQCLLSDAIKSSPEDALAADHQQGLDLLGLLGTHGLGLYGAMKLINFIRTLVLKHGVSAEQVVAQVQDVDSLRAALQGDEMLQPVLEDDPLLFALGELLEAHGLDLLQQNEEEGESTGEEERDAENGAGTQAMAAGDQKVSDRHLSSQGQRGLVQENHELREELGEVRARLKRLSELMAAVDEDVKIRTKPERQDNDTYYFKSYSHYCIHETMLKDTVRTQSYREAIHKAGLEGKVVLDVGSGSGVLSMFAAKAGAAQVVGVDCSRIMEQARAIVKLNGLEEKVVLVQGKMEEVNLPVDKVDVIVSEWMGYCLLYESMLPSVLAARDKYLRPGGLLLPSRCTMLVQGVGDFEGKLGWWDNVYGLDMSPLRESVLAEPGVEVADPQAILTDAFVFKDFDLYNVQVEDLDFEADFSLIVGAASGATVVGSRRLRGLVVSFDTYFLGLSGGQSVVFSTRPNEKDTHWHQTLFWLTGAPEEELGGGDMVKGKLCFSRNAINPRDYDVAISWEVLRKEGEVVVGQGRQSYTLGS